MWAKTRRRDAIDARREKQKSITSFTLTGQVVLEVRPAVAVDEPVARGVGARCTSYLLVPRAGRTAGTRSVRLGLGRVTPDDQLVGRRLHAHPLQSIHVLQARQDLVLHAEGQAELVLGASFIDTPVFLRWSFPALVSRWKTWSGAGELKHYL